MALDLGLGNEETIQSLTTEHERTDLRFTWWSVVMLDIISSWSELLLFLFLSGFVALHLLQLLGIRLT